MPELHFKNMYLIVWLIMIGITVNNLTIWHWQKNMDLQFQYFLCWFPPENWRTQYNVVRLLFSCLKISWFIPKSADLFKWCWSLKNLAFQTLCYLATANRYIVWLKKAMSLGKTLFRLDCEDITPIRSPLNGCVNRDSVITPWPRSKNAVGKMSWRT